MDRYYGFNRCLVNQGEREVCESAFPVLASETGSESGRKDYPPRQKAS
jgi:hypothetical protein